MGLQRSIAMLRGAISLALLGFLSSTPAHAHATLLQTVPAANSRVEQPPREVMLSFDERVETIFNSVEVLDEKGDRVDDGSPRVSDQGDVLFVNLKPLSSGRYVVSWKVVSLDSHQVEGNFGFGVNAAAPGDADMTRLIRNRGKQQSTVFTAIIKWIGLTAMTVWLGGISFWMWVFTPVAKTGAIEDQRIVSVRFELHRRAFAKSSGYPAAIFAVAQCLMLMDQAAVFSGLSFLATLSPLTLWTVVSKTNYGAWWGIRMMASLALAATLLPYLSSSTWKTEPKTGIEKKNLLGLFWVICGSLILLSLPLTGHARAVPHATIVAIASDWVHLAATAAWIGGLVFLAAISSIQGIAAPDHSTFLSSLVARFSLLAKISVASLALTGIYAAWLHLPNWNSFLSTSYGRALTVKLLLIAPMLLIGLVNWRRVVPALAEFSRHPHGRANLERATACATAA